MKRRKDEKDKEIFGLMKLPDKAIIADLEKLISEQKVKMGKM